MASDSLGFPDPAEAERDDGLLAVGGDFNPNRLLRAYASGLFPCSIDEGMEITWFSPDPRDDLHIPKSLMKTLRKIPRSEYLQMLSSALEGKFCEDEVL